ncbi:MAG: hypothetical protein KC492_22460, partial [Myxococcales bacterium]|nr:hypothetical protein [Myxococcales bacterium]
MAKAEMIGQLAAIARLSDDELIRRTQRLAQTERQAVAELVAHLAEVDARRLFARFAASSLFDYCVRELGFSEPQAFLRIRVARAARRHPRLLGLIACGALHLSGLKLIAPELEAADADALIEQACGKTCRQIDALLAERRPRPSVAEQIRKLPTPDLGSPRQSELASQPAVVRARELSAAPTPASAEREPRSLQTASVPAPPIELPQPLGRDRFKVTFTADGKLVGLLEELRALYRHRDPNAELATIVTDAAKMLRDALLKQRFGVGAQPRPKKPRSTTARKKAALALTAPQPAAQGASSEPKPTSGAAGNAPSERKTTPRGESGERKTTGRRVVSRHIPLEVRRQVFLR